MRELYISGSLNLENPKTEGYLATMIIQQYVKQLIEVNGLPFLNEEKEQDLAPLVIGIANTLGTLNKLRTQPLSGYGLQTDFNVATSIIKPDGSVPDVHKYASLTVTEVDMSQSGGTVGMPNVLNLGILTFGGITEESTDGLIRTIGASLFGLNAEADISVSGTGVLSVITLEKDFVGVKTIKLTELKRIAEGKLVYSAL